MRTVRDVPQSQQNSYPLPAGRSLSHDPTTVGSLSSPAYTSVKGTDRGKVISPRCNYPNPLALHAVHQEVTFTYVRAGQIRNLFVLISA